MGILRNTLESHSRNLAFVFQKCQLYCSSNRNKKETTSLPGRLFSVAAAGRLTFPAPTCWPPQPCGNRNAALAEPEPNINHGFNIFMPCLPGKGFPWNIWITENMCTSYVERQNILLLDDPKNLFPFNWVRGGEKGNSSRKVIVWLRHTSSC